MNIAATQYSLSSKTLEIFLAGCNDEKCNECFNPELWDFKKGTNYKNTIEKICKKIKDFSNIIDNIMIMGGEPLDQDVNCLFDLLSIITNNNLSKKKNMWLFTKYNFEDIPEDIKKFCDYIKCGRFDKNKKTDNNKQFGIDLASDNQKIYKRGKDF